ncbi:MAG: FAD-binding oxidoreductase [Candidatus Diapherotrites archaeon]
MEFEAKVLKITNYPSTGKVQTRVAQLSAPGNFSFKPGQFCMIAFEEVKLLSNPSQLKWASYSVCNSPAQKGFIELSVANFRTETGVSFHFCEKMKAGDKVKVKGPFGNFVLKPESAQKEIALIAMGCGIAAMMCLLRTLHEQKFPNKVSLFFGFRNRELYLFREEIEKLQKEWKNFEANVITSREEWNGKRGHVQDLIAAYDFPEDKSGMHVYMCGAPSATEEMVQALKAKGFKEEQVFKEKW